MKKVVLIASMGSTSINEIIRKGDNEMERYVNMTEKEINKVKRHMDAFVSNFGDIIQINKSVYDKGFYIYLNKGEAHRFSSDNLDTINGWLYGCVQTINGVVHK